MVTGSRNLILLMLAFMVCAAMACEGLAAEQPSIVRVHGTRLIVESRMANGSLDAPKPFIIKGVNWSPATRAPDKGIDPIQPTRIISYGFFFDVPYARSSGYQVWDYWLKKEYRKHYKEDIPLMKAMNISTVRIHNFGIEKDGYRRVLDAFNDNGIKVIMALDVNKKEAGSRKRIEKIINLYKDHPAILMWSLEPAWNIQANEFYEFGSPGNTIKAVNRAAGIIKKIDPNHPVDVSIAEMLFGEEKTSPGQQFVLNCDNVDVFGVTVYSENGLANVLTRWKKLTPKPLYIGRVGTDSFKTESYTLANGYQATKVKGKEDQKTQADYIVTVWDTIRKNLSASDPEKVCLGALVTEFNDALWPVGCYHYQMGGVFDYNDIRYEKHYKEYDTDGMYFKGGAPDDVVNTEYLGIVDADRKPKLAYTELRRIYKELDDIATKPIEEVSDKK
jgi:hypothetical protein